jgi:hypothetical protein
MPYERMSSRSEIPLRALALLLALMLLGGVACATRVSLRDTDPARKAVVFGKVEGWILGPQVLGTYANQGSMSLRCDGFFLYDRRTERRYPIDLASSGHFELAVPPGEYLLKRSQKDLDGKEESTDRFGSFTARAGALHNLGTIRVSGGLANEQIVWYRRETFSMLYPTMVGWFQYSFAYPENEASWSGPLDEIRTAQKDPLEADKWVMTDVNLLRGRDWPHPPAGESRPSAWDEGPALPASPLAGELVSHPQFHALFQLLQNSPPGRAEAIFKERGLEPNGRIPSHGFEGMTPFLLACLTGNPEAVKDMLDRGGDAKARCDYHDDSEVHRNATSLYMALMGFKTWGSKTSERYLRTAQLLLEAGADPVAVIARESLDPREEGTFTPLELARAWASKDPAFKPLLELLLKYSPSLTRARWMVSPGG